MMEAYFFMYNLTAFLVFLLLKCLVTILKEILEGSLPRLTRKWETTNALEFRTCSWILLLLNTFENWRFGLPQHSNSNLLEVCSRIPFWNSGFPMHVSMYCSGTITDLLCSLVFSCFSDFSFDDSCFTVVQHLVFTCSTSYLA